jgi:hypothetical protein
MRNLKVVREPAGVTRLLRSAVPRVTLGEA